MTGNPRDLHVSDGRAHGAVTADGTNPRVGVQARFRGLESASGSSCTRPSSRHSLVTRRCALVLGLVAGAAARGPVVLQCLPALSRLPVRPPLAQASTPLESFVLTCCVRFKTGSVYESSSLTRSVLAAAQHLGAHEPLVRLRTASGWRIRPARPRDLNSRTRSQFLRAPGVWTS